MVLPGPGPGQHRKDRVATAQPQDEFIVQNSRRETPDLRWYLENTAEFQDDTEV